MNKAQSPEYNGDPKEVFTICNIEEEGHCVRVLSSAQHLLKNNPTLKELKLQTAFN